MRAVTAVVLLMVFASEKSTIFTFSCSFFLSGYTSTLQGRMAPWASFRSIFRNAAPRASDPTTSIVSRQPNTPPVAIDQSPLPFASAIFFSSVSAELW